MTCLPYGKDNKNFEKYTKISVSIHVHLLYLKRHFLFKNFCIFSWLQCSNSRVAWGTITPPSRKELSVVEYGATWHTFKPKFEKLKKIHSDKIFHVFSRGCFSYISENGTFQLQD